MVKKKSDPILRSGTGYPSFLRLSDTRYFGLTPGQYAGLAVIVATLYALRRNDAAPG